jgi:3-methylfumaryl-CoA hydratase
MTIADGELVDAVAGWSPSPLTSEEAITAERVEQLAATLDLDIPVREGAPLPLLWQWIFFQDWRPTSELGADGHPAEGHFFPPIPHRRRKFAGGRTDVAEPLEIGRPATRRTSLESLTPKQGRTGLLFFATLRHQFIQDGRMKLIEEQDVVYRCDTGIRTPFSRTEEPLADSPAPWTTNPVVDPVRLFRLSAVTANAHRIHYDRDYATGVEGYPGLVVHGPLLALFMAGLAEHSKSPGATLKGFSFRLHRPLILGDAFRVDGTPTPGTASADLSVVSGHDVMHASATATYT